MYSFNDIAQVLAGMRLRDNFRAPTYNGEGDVELFWGSSTTWQQPTTGVVRPRCYTSELTWREQREHVALVVHATRWKRH